MFPTKVARAAGTGASVPVECCQICGNAKLETVLSLGYMPPVNQMKPVGEPLHQLPWFPTTLLYCDACELVQLGAETSAVGAQTRLDPLVIGNRRQAEAECIRHAGVALFRRTLTLGRRDASQKRNSHCDDGAPQHQGDDQYTTPRPVPACMGADRLQRRIFMQPNSHRRRLNRQRSILGISLTSLPQKDAA